MNRFNVLNGARRIALIAAALLLAACQSVPQNSAGWPGVPDAAFAPAPPILSLTTRDGKGWPYGQTDSGDRWYTSFRLQAASKADYGYTANNPIRTSLGDRSIPTHIWFLNSLRGPKGEVVKYERIGSCCAFNDARLPLGGGLLDAYRLHIDGVSQGVIIYMDMYRPGVPYLPQGLTQRPLMPQAGSGSTAPTPAPMRPTPLKPGEMKI